MGLINKYTVAAGNAVETVVDKVKKDKRVEQAQEALSKVKGAGARHEG
eukprot:COSAG01_NODE_32236_length_584_cov_1.154639_1_plen_47_part_10